MREHSVNSLFGILLCCFLIHYSNIMSTKNIYVIVLRFIFLWRTFQRASTAEFKAKTLRACFSTTILFAQSSLWQLWALISNLLKRSQSIYPNFYAALSYRLTMNPYWSSFFPLQRNIFLKVFKVMIALLPFEEMFCLFFRLKLYLTEKINKEQIGNHF